MKIRDKTGITLTQATDGALNEIMETFDISRANARTILGECLNRNYIMEQIIELAGWLLSEPEKEEKKTGKTRGRIKIKL